MTGGLGKSRRDGNAEPDLVVTAARAASQKRGEDTIILEVGPILGITDEFVITSGRNTRQVRTIAEEVERAVKEAGGVAPIRTEGLDDARWVLLDYGDFVVHLFLEEARSYYELERLWGDASRRQWSDEDVGESASVRKAGSTLRNLPG